MAHSCLRCHLPRAPMSPALRLRLERLHEHPLDVLVGVLAGRAYARLVVEAVEPMLDEAASPLADGLITRPVRARYRRVGLTIGAPKNQLRPERHRTVHARSVGQPNQFCSLRL